jgi:hypothetical protein
VDFFSQTAFILYEFFHHGLKVRIASGPLTFAPSFLLQICIGNTVGTCYADRVGAVSPFAHLQAAPTSPRWLPRRWGSRFWEWLEIMAIGPCFLGCRSVQGMPIGNAQCDKLNSGHSIVRFKIRLTVPYSSPTKPSNSCSISCHRPSLLVHLPFSSCRAA